LTTIAAVGIAMLFRVNRENRWRDVEPRRMEQPLPTNHGTT